MTTESKPVEWCIASTDGSRVWSFYGSRADAKKDLPRIQQRKADDLAAHLERHAKYEHRDRRYWLRCYYNEKRLQYVVMSYKRFEQLQRRRVLKPATLSDADTFNEMLNVLPPYKWTSHGGGEIFLMSEFNVSNFTASYSRYKGSFGEIYLYKVVDAYDKTTWPTLEDAMRLAS